MNRAQSAHEFFWPYGLGTSVGAFPDSHTVSTSAATAVHYARSWESSGGS